MEEAVADVWQSAAGRIESLAARHSLPGVVFALVAGRRLAGVHAFGETRLGNGRRPTQDSVFRIASMTKSFTAAAILLLRDRGALSLDEPIVTYLPWARTIGAPDGSAPIAVRDLLTMNGGFPTDDPWGDRQENRSLSSFDALVAGGLSFTREPRTGFEYSNLGYALLGRIVTRVSGVDYPEFVRRELLDPLEMRSTVFDSGEVDEDRRAQGYALSRRASSLSRPWRRGHLVRWEGFIAPHAI